VAATNRDEPISITLSVEELLVVLNTLQAPSIPGLEAEAWTKLTPDQQNVSLSVAGRALEARGLAEIDQFGALLIHRALLTAVGVCAYPQKTALVDYWPANDPGQRLYAYTRDNDSAVHTVNRGLHTFVLLPSEAALVNHLVEACQWSNSSATPALELTIPRDEFTKVCDASADGGEAEALKILNSATKADGAGTALVHSLVSAPRISVVRSLRYNGGQVGPEQSFTVIDGADQAWLVAGVTNDANSQLKARTTSRDEIGKTLLRGF